MKMIRKVILVLLILSITSQLKAIMVFSNDINKVDIMGDINLAYLNKLKEEDYFSFINNNDYNSYLGISVENHSLPLATTRAVMDFKINNKFYFPDDKGVKSNKKLEVNNLYLEIITIDDSITRVGSFDSVVTKDTVRATDKGYIYLLDAGFSFMNKSLVYGDKSGEDFSTIKTNGIGNLNNFTNYKIAFEVSFPKTQLENRSEIDNDSVRRNYSFGASFKYEGEIFSYAIGYKKIRNRLKKDVDNPNLSKKILDSDNFLSSITYNGEKLYLAIAGGYYNNQKLAGINHTGASAIASYKLTKVVPYIGYQFLYANNIHSSIKNCNDIYGIKDRKNYSFDQSELVLGVSYQAHEGFIIGIEHDNDLRKKSYRKSSLLNNISQDVTSIYLQYLI